MYAKCECGVVLVAIQKGTDDFRFMLYEDKDTDPNYRPPLMEP